VDRRARREERRFLPGGDFNEFEFRLCGVILGPLGAGY